MKQLESAHEDVDPVLDAPEGGLGMLPEELTVVVGNPLQWVHQSKSPLPSA